MLSLFDQNCLLQIKVPQAHVHRNWGRATLSTVWVYRGTVCRKASTLRVNTTKRIKRFYSRDYSRNATDLKTLHQSYDGNPAFVIILDMTVKADICQILLFYFTEHIFTTGTRFYRKHWFIGFKLNDSWLCWMCYLRMESCGYSNQSR